MVADRSLAAEFYVALTNEFKESNLELPEGAQLVKTLKQLEIFIVQSDQINLKIKNAKFVFKRSFVGPRPGRNSEFKVSPLLRDSQFIQDSEETIVGPYPWGVAAVKAPELWRRGHTGAGIKVLLLDSGHVREHPVLSNVVKGARDYTDSKVGIGVPYSEYDITGHATHIAATIAGNGFNKIYGVAPDAEIYIGKVCVFICEKVDGMVEAIEWGLFKGIKIISMSFSVGTKRDWADLNEHVFGRLEALNVLSVSSAGNSGLQNGVVQYPAKHPYVLAVGAIDYNSFIADFSTRGPEVSLVAPGVDIVSASLLKGINSTPTLLSMMSGTSMAVPHVSGAAALLMGAYPNASVSEIREALLDGATPVMGRSDEYGRGLLNVESAFGILDN